MRYSFNHSCYSSLCWRNSAEILPKFCQNSNRNRDTYFQDNMSFRFEVNSWNVWNIPSWQCITHRNYILCSCPWTLSLKIFELILCMRSFFGISGEQASPYHTSNDSKFRRIVVRHWLRWKFDKNNECMKLYFARLTHEFLEFKPNECSFDSVKLTCHHFVIQIYLTDFSHIEINSISMICCFFFGNRQFERVFVLFFISLFLCSFCSTLISKRNARCWICISKC